MAIFFTSSICYTQILKKWITQFKMCNSYVLYFLLQIMASLQQFLSF